MKKQTIYACTDSKYTEQNWLFYMTRLKRVVFLCITHILQIHWSADHILQTKIFSQNIDCGYMSESPKWGGSNE